MVMLEEAVVAQRPGLRPSAQPEVGWSPDVPEAREGAEVGRTSRTRLSALLGAQPERFLAAQYQPSGE